MKITKLTTLYTAEEIQERVRKISCEINELYKDEPLVVICVLKGGFMFFSDLVKHLTIRPCLDFVRLASYGLGTESSKKIIFAKDVEADLCGKNVLIVEDIVDTGRSMAFLSEHLAGRGAKSFRIAALVDKVERREVDVKVDFAGFKMEGKGFIVGYGLDYAEQFRELPAIYVADVSC